MHEKLRTIATGPIFFQLVGNAVFFASSIFQIGMVKAIKQQMTKKNIKIFYFFIFRQNLFLKLNWRIICFVFLWDFFGHIYIVTMQHKPLL